MSRPVTRTQSPRIGAFFDMDKTLIAENSGTLYFKYRFARGELSRWEVAKGLFAYLQYKAGVLDITAWTRTAMEEFAGQSERAMARDANRWFRECVEPTIYPEAESLVKWHQAQGHIVAIVSGSTRFVVKPLAERLGIRHFLYTRLEAEHGRFTGRVVEPVCFEEGKIYWLQQLIEEQQIELAKSFFYTDSITDLPLLDIVGHPVVTNPDPFLYREAVRRRWPVRFFTPPSLESPPREIEVNAGVALPTPR